MVSFSVAFREQLFSARIYPFFRKEPLNRCGHLEVFSRQEHNTLPGGGRDRSRQAAKQQQKRVLRRANALPCL